MSYELKFFSFYHDATAPSGPGPPHCRSFTITFRHATLGRTPLDERSARRIDLYQTTHNVPYPRRDSNPQSPASERPQTHALDRAATGTGNGSFMCVLFKVTCSTQNEGNRDPSGAHLRIKDGRRRWNISTSWEA